ncbi:site-specific integrase [Pelagibius sp.]|uniref:tyrosine-type recombinase/integrase n=1 Tax=Pelagibius sp. TaxID=1931238 RepID=UPI002610D165|nr:site-specific integrase [Pelagibius sp.]
MPRDPYASPTQAGGLRVVQRSSSTKLYLSGTVRIGKKSIRIRESTGLEARQPGAWAAAEVLRIKREAEVLDRFVYKRLPDAPFADVAEEFLRVRQPVHTSVRMVREFIAAFGRVPIADLDRTELEGYFIRRCRHVQPTTRRRLEGLMAAVLNYAAKAGYLYASPYWPRIQVRNQERSAAMKRFYPGEVELLIDCAADQLKPMLAVLYATGARVGQVVHLKRTHFTFSGDFGRVFFPKTKNGHCYLRPLHPYAAGMMQDWFRRRRDIHPEAFLTERGRPYPHIEGRGGHIRHAFARAKRRCVRQMKALGYHERAMVIQEATPHWFRHNFANTLRQDLGLDAKAIALAGMWRNPAVVERFYISDVPIDLEAVVTALPLGQRLGSLPAPSTKTQHLPRTAINGRLCRGESGLLEVRPEKELWTDSR